MHITDIIIRLVLAVIIGGSVGYERGFKHRPAGFRTHILVCIGATVIALIQENSCIEAVSLINSSPALSQAIKIDLNRLGAQVVAGVGFIGAGTIIQEKGSVIGLTTAASLWIVACLGLATGAGYFSLAILGCIFTVISLVFFNKIECKFLNKQLTMRLELIYIDKSTTSKEIDKIFKSSRIVTSAVETTVHEDISKNIVTYDSIYSLQLPYNTDVNILEEKLLSINNISKLAIL